MDYWSISLRAGNNAFSYEGPSGRAADLMATIVPYLQIAYYGDQGVWRQVLADTYLRTYVTLNVKVTQDCLWSIGQDPRATLGPVSITLRDIKYTVYPELVPAGEQYSIVMQLGNSGKAGRGRVLFNDQVMSDRNYADQEVYNLTVSDTMPYNDLAFHIKLMSDDRQTEERTIGVNAGYPGALFAGVSDPPAYLTPGEGISIPLAVRNIGYRGNIGIVVRDWAGNDVSRTDRVNAGAEVGYLYEAEMPPVRRIAFQARGLYLGKGKEWRENDIRRFSVSARNCLLHEDGVIYIIGGHEPAVAVKGFVAGEDIVVTNLDQLGPAVSSPLPWRGVALFGDVAPAVTAAISFTRLDYFRVEFDREMATAKDGSLSSKGSKSYEYSSLPSLGGAQALLGRALATATRKAPTLRR